MPRAETLSGLEPALFSSRGFIPYSSPCGSFFVTVHAGDQFQTCFSYVCVYQGLVLIMSTKRYISVIDVIQSLFLHLQGSVGPALLFHCPSARF